METQSFWTILPNGIANGRARLSVFVTPKLLGETGNLYALSDFPDMLNWPEIVANIGFRLYWRSASSPDVADVAGGKVFAPTNRGEFGLDARIWNHLFATRKIVVEPETPPDLTGPAIVGVHYRAAILERIVRETQAYYMLLSLAAPGEEPNDPVLDQTTDRLVRMAGQSDGPRLDLREFPQKEGESFFYPPARTVTNFFRENLNGNGSATIQDLATSNSLIAAQYNAFALYHRHGVQNKNYRIRRPVADGRRLADFNFSTSPIKTITASDNGLFFEFAENMDVVLPPVADVPPGFGVTLFFAPDESRPEGISFEEMGSRLPRRGIRDNGGVDYQPIAIRAGAGDSFDGGQASIPLQAFRGLKLLRSSKSKWIAQPLEQQDFHAIVSGLSSYPILMRRLGLLFDIDVEASELPTSEGQFELLVGPAFDPAAGVPGRPNFSAHSSWSACRTGEFATQIPAGISFQSFAIAAGDASDLTTVGGFQRLNNGVADTLAIGHSFQDIDTAVHKTIQKAVKDGALPDPASMDKDRNPFKAERRVLMAGSPKAAAGAADPVEIEGTFRQPASRSTGITLYMDQDGAKSARRFSMDAASANQRLLAADVEKAGPADLVNAPVSHRDDVSAGLKIDVYITGPEVPPEDRRWYSLTRRQLKFNFLNNEELGQYLAPADEAWIEKAGTSEKDEHGDVQLRINDYSFKWDQWSLSAPHPSRATPELGDGDEQWQRSTDLAVQAESVALSLAKLRYGRIYYFRGRIADIAGNAIHFDYANAAMPTPDEGLGKELASDPITYRRHDPISPPVLYALQKPGPGSKKPDNAEGNVGPDQSDIVIIRSGSSVPASLAQAEWLILPPDTDFQEMEWAGMLDGFDDPDEAYETLERYDGEVPKEYDPHFLTTIRWPNGKLGTPYIPDGYAAGATFRYLPGMGRKPVKSSLALSQKVGSALEHVMQVAFNLRPKIANGSKPFSEPFRMRLKSGPRSSVKTADGLAISLPPGEQQLITISCYPDPNRLDHFEHVDAGLLSAGPFFVQTAAEALVAFLKGSDDDIRKSLEAGLNYLITPSKTVRLIHAVPKPIAVPKFSAALRVTNRVTGGNAVVMEDAGLVVHTVSTGKIDVFAEWDEYLDVPGEATFPVIRRQRFPCFSRDVTLPDTTIEPDGTHTTFDLGGRHNVPSNKHLQVAYRAVATTRYKEYFADDITSTAANLTVESDLSCDFHIFNTAPPPPPQIAYILPLFLWKNDEKKLDDGSVATTIERRAGFRIYMKRGWFRSGRDERLAVILQSTVDGAANSSPSSPPVPVTQIGSDPIWYDENPIRRQPTLSDCLAAERVAACPAPVDYDPANPHVPSPAVSMCGTITESCLISVRPGAILPAPVLPAEIVSSSGSDTGSDQTRTPDGYGPDLSPDQELRVDVAAYAVACDNAKDLIYADVELESFGAYTPFVRFSLARYQKHSAKYCALSPLTTVDYVQLNPLRTISIVHPSSASGEKIVVSVFGPGKGDVGLGFAENLLRLYRMNNDLVLEQFPLEIKGKWLQIAHGEPSLYQWQFEIDPGARGKYFVEEVEMIPEDQSRIIFSSEITL